MEELLALIEGDALAGKGKQLQLRRIDFREHRNSTEQFDIFVDAQVRSPSFALRRRRSIAWHHVTRAYCAAISSSTTRPSRMTSTRSNFRAELGRSIIHITPFPGRAAGVFHDLGLPAASKRGGLVQNPECPGA